MARADISGKTATATVNAWPADPNNNSPFYESQALVDPESNASLSPSGTDPWLLSETFTITNGAGNGTGLLNSVTGNTNHTLTGIAVGVAGGGTGANIVYMHLFDVTSNLTSNNGSDLNGSGASYGFTNNGDLLGGGNGLVWTNNNLAGAAQIDYLGLGNGPTTDDQVVLASNHTYALEMWITNGASSFFWFKDVEDDQGGQAMGSTDSAFTVQRKTITSLGQAGGAPRTFALALYGYATNAPASVNTNLYTVPPAAPPPPTLGIFKAVPALRMFAGSGPPARQELATASGFDVNWVGATAGSPVQYSFTIIGDAAQTNYFQTHIFLVPVNTIPNPPGQGAYNNNYVEYQASNLLWLQIQGTNGSPMVSANISWKTNTPNANPNIIALSLTNAALIGTWTLAFTSPTQGTLTAPGASAMPFSIADPTASTDFAGPVTAYFGVEANTAGGAGGYDDYSRIAITGVAGNALVDNFPTDTSLNTSFWNINPTAADTSVILVTTNYPLWITWTSPATGFGLGVTPTLPITASAGNPGGFVLPQSYNGYFDDPIVNNEGGSEFWALIPSDCLPSNVTPGANAFFEVINPPPAN
jgi:hypothetical protein